MAALQGETLRSLAQRVYGTSSLWYVLADANGLSDPNGQLIAARAPNSQITLRANTRSSPR